MACTMTVAGLQALTATPAHERLHKPAAHTIPCCDKRFGGWTSIWWHAYHMHSQQPADSHATCAQIVTTVLVWENCWYFMPSAADEDPILQVSTPGLILHTAAAEPPASSLHHWACNVCQLRLANETKGTLPTYLHLQGMHLRMLQTLPCTAQCLIAHLD